jgi:hypothetical protein
LCFKEKKTTKLNFQLAQYEKNKFDKDNFEKKLIKQNMWGNTVARQKSCGEHCSNPQCFKELQS